MNFFGIVLLFVLLSAVFFVGYDTMILRKSVITVGQDVADAVYSYDLKSLNGSMSCVFQDVPLTEDELNSLCVDSNDWHLVSTEINYDFEQPQFMATCCNLDNYCLAIYVNNFTNPCSIKFHAEAVNKTYINGTFIEYGGCCFWE